MNKVVCFFLLVVFFPFGGKAQHTIWSFRDCMEYGRQHHLDFKIKQLEIMLAQNNAVKLSYTYLPEIGFSANHNYNFGSTIDPSTNNRISSNVQSDLFSLDSQIALFNFSEIKKSKLDRLESAFQRQDNEVILQEYNILLLKKFYEAFAAQEWVNILEKQLVNSENQLERIRKEVSTGLKPESDLYDIEVIYSQEKIVLQQAIHEYENKKTQLFQNIFFIKDDYTSYSLHEDLLSVEENIEFDLNSNNKIKKSDIELQKAIVAYQQTLSNFLPKLSLYYSYGTFYANQIKNISDTSFNFERQLQTNKSNFLGLSLYVPVFSKGNATRLRNAKRIEKEIKEQQKQNMIQATQNEFNLEKQQLHQLITLESQIAENIRFSTLSFQTTTSKFIYGKVDAITYKTAQNQLLLSEYNYLNNQLLQNMGYQKLLLLNNNF